MKALFVTGTDTGCGKTVVTGLLAGYLFGRGMRVITQKWVQTGTGDDSSDIEIHRSLGAFGKGDPARYRREMVPYRLSLPASPHLAAERVKVRIDSRRIERSFNTLKRAYDFVIIEGTGGLLVPYTRKRYLADIALQLKIPLIIVVGNRLGAINHALLTVEAARRRGCVLLGLVFTTPGNETPAEILEDNRRVIAALSGLRALGTLPFCADYRRLCREFAPVGKAIYATIRRY